MGLVDPRGQFRPDPGFRKFGRRWSANMHMAVIMTMQVAHIAYVGQRGLTRPGVFFAPIPSVRALSQRQPVDRLMATEDYPRIQALPHEAGFRVEIRLL